MLTLGSAEHAAIFGFQNQWDRLAEHNQPLQQAALDLIEKTKPDVIYSAASAESIPHANQLPMWPDFAKWDERNVLELYEAACLWNDEEPSLPMNAAALHVFWEFYKAIYEKRLGTKANLDLSISLAMIQSGGWPLTPDQNDPVNVHTKVSRRHLEPYARSIGGRPKFLFRDQRAKRGSVHVL